MIRFSVFLIRVFDLFLRSMYWICFCSSDAYSLIYKTCPLLMAQYLLYLGSQAFVLCPEFFSGWRGYPNLP